jgi:hypothetical protein
MSLLQEIEQHGLADCEFNRNLINKFVVENTFNNEILWSNDFGWVSQESNSFDVFSFQEMQSLNLPIEGTWVEWVDFSNNAI